jgi:hypothetical protein
MDIRGNESAHAGSPTNADVLNSGDSKQKAGAIVDGFALLRFCKIQHPNDAESCVAVGKKIRGVVAEDAAFFKNLK